MPAPFFWVKSVPVQCSTLWPTREEAQRCPVGDIRLSLCGVCGLIYNRAFDPALLEREPAFDNATGFSSELRKYHEEQAVDLICRHVLEHLHQPRELLGMIRQTAARRAGSVVFFEVPNALHTLREMGIWDIIYVRCSYFTPRSLRRLIEGSGYTTGRTETRTGGQYICLEAGVDEGAAVPAARPSDDDADAGKGTTEAAKGADEQAVEAVMTAEAEEVAALAGTFGGKHREKLAHWRRTLSDLFDDGARIAVWGAGAKGVTFLNALDDTRRVDCVVDPDPRKHGLFVPRAGHQVAAPETLGRVRPDVVIVMNPVQAKEIEQMLRDLSLASRVLLA